MNKAERLWSLRDGALAWLYGLRVDGVTINEAKPADFMAATAWSDTEVTRAELNDAISWLKDEGYVDGNGTWQGPILRPRLTSYGEKYAAAGKSVRAPIALLDDPARYPELVDTAAASRAMAG